MRNEVILTALLCSFLLQIGPAMAHSDQDRLGPRGQICVDHQSYCRKLEASWDQIEAFQNASQTNESDLAQLVRGAEALCALAPERCEQLRNLRARAAAASTMQNPRRPAASSRPPLTAPKAKPAAPSLPPRSAG